MDERPPADEESGGGSTAPAAGEGASAANDAAAVDAAAAALTVTTGDGDGPGPPEQLSPSYTGSGKGFSAPEPPKWRFVDQAKKSLGYSSHAAGTVVQGLSAEELVGKYEPKWKPSDSKPNPVEHVKEQVAEIDHDVEEAVEKDSGDVSRLVVQEGGDTVEETFEGTFAGFRKKGDEETSTDDSQKSAPLANEEMKRMVKEAVKEAMSELVVKAEEGVTEAPDPAEPESALAYATPAVRVSVEGREPEPKAANGNEQPPELEKTVEEDKQKKKKQRCLLLLLILIVAIIAIALGVSLGVDEKEESSNRAIDSWGLVSEDDNATITPTTTPSGSPTQPPTANPSSAEPTKSPTLKPTSSPTTARPTGSPTLQPTLQPTCDTSYEDFNLCFAIDMSGSVCNAGTGYECEGCLPDFICNDVGFDISTCCANFFSVTSFTKSLVDSLEPLPVDKAYSIVGFASGAMVAQPLGPSEDTLTALDDLVYTGGRTNHADAIDACALSLRSSGGEGRNLVLLITDGDPSEPQGSPLEDAELAADRAKSEGAFIIPLVVTEESSSFAANQEYLQGISSDGSVFKVSDFDGLDTIQEGLLAQVSCQV